MKRILSFLLAVALLAGLVVLPVAAEPDVTPVTELCPHCNTAWDACDWQPIDSIDLSEDILSGHYYLTEDTALSALFGLGTKDGQTADYAVDVCLDLRGYDMTREKKDTRVAYVYNYSRFAVMDTVGGGVLSATGDTVGGAVYIAANGEFHLYSGTILTTSTGRTKNGGVIYGTGGSSVYIHGGMIDATGVSADISTDDTPAGGGMYISGYGEINGGMILGGYMERGGAVYVSSSGTLRMTDGYIYGGEAGENGGNIFNYGDTYISGGKIIGGVAANNGGNIFSGYSNSDTKLYSDLHVSGGYIADGRASSNGSNVMINSANGSITGGEIKGNVYLNTNVLLSGSPVIDNYGYEGLYATATKKLVIKDLNADARIILRGSSTVTDTELSPDVATYLANGQLIPASRYALTMTDGVLKSSQDDEGYCPHCEKNVSWKKYTADTNTSGHYYTASGGFTASAGSAALNIASDVDIVLNIAHSTVKAGARYYVEGKLTVLSSATNVINFYNTNASTTENGAAIFVKSTGTLNLYDGVIKGTTTSGNGGAIYVNGGTFNMYGGAIIGGKATNGGSVYAYNNSTKFNMYGGVITGGSATNSAGNVFVGTATFNMYDGVIENGTATSNGGNIQAGTSGVANIRGGMLLGGKATNYGGNFYTASTSSRLNMYDGIMQNGSAKNGGNIYANNGVVSITGGTIQNGVASTYGGNIYNNNGKYFVDNNGDLTKNYMIIGDNDVADDIAAPVLLGGKANYGGNLYNTGYATLGACTFLDGEATYGSEIYYGKVASITVKPDFTQTIAMYVHADLIKELEATGTLLKAVCTELNATIYVENYDMALLVEAGDVLGLAGAALVNMSDSSLRWFKSAQEAADACTSEEFIRLYGTGHSLQLKGDTILDVNGAAVTVTGSGKLYGFDSRNDSYKTYGTVTLSGMEVENPFTAPNGNTYIAVTDGEGTSFHRVDMVISDVVLRPSAAGLYYKAKFRCDEKLTDFVTSFGVAVSTVDRPGTDFETDSDTLYASFAGNTLGTEAVSSMLVQDILKETLAPAEAKARGEKFVFAGAFMKLSVDGEEIVVLSRDQSPWSLKTVLEHLNTYWRTLPEADKTALMDSIYTPYISQFDEDWGLFYMRYTYRDMTPEEKAVLEARRQTVLDYMRSSLTLLWTPTETLTYGLAQRDNGTTLKVVAGRVYQGVPYAYAVGTEQSFLEYAVAQNEKGIYTISNLEATALNYEAYGARVGNDCSGAVTNAWSQIGTSFTTSRSATMLPSYGALPAGDYDFCPTINYESNVITYTAIVNKTNGEQRMYEAYAELLPADAVFYVATSGSNHIRMVSEVYVARNSDGTIDGANSYIKVLEQTRSNQTAGKTKTVEGIGTVYVVGGVDVKYTFEKLFSGNYIPCTIKELRDPTPVEETWIQDTQVVNTAENLFEGVIMSNRYIDCVTITIEDVDGNVVQQSTGRARRRYNKEFYMNRFVIENAGARIGVVDLSALESGQYRCKITARLTIGDTYVVRDFNFEK